MVLVALDGQLNISLLDVHTLGLLASGQRMVSMAPSKGPTGVRLRTRPPCKGTLELEDSSCQTKLLFMY